MTQHPDLFGSAQPPKLTDRLFFALFPSEEAMPHSGLTAAKKLSKHTQ